MNNRIIKFRIWDEKYRCWVDNSFLLYPKEEIKIQGRILTQFTGLTDENNKEIYEGDILKCPNRKINKFVEVIFDLQKTAFLIKDWSLLRTIDEFKFNNKIIVAGNIFENLSLLNEKI